MKTDEKNNIMKKFESNEINLLVSTTVIEVGVDIPNATVMVVEHAERFGLTQLHQLRGRVGRGPGKSYCILVHHKVTDNSRLRLDIMERTNDGFQIADEDLKLRGPGDYIGTRQSGSPLFKVAQIEDSDLLSLAKVEAERILGNDPDLKDPSNSLLYEKYQNELEELYGQVS